MAHGELIGVTLDKGVRFKVHLADKADKATKTSLAQHRLKGLQPKTVNIFQLVYDWLRDERRCWVLILDNVDDAGFLSEPCSDRDRSAGRERSSNSDASQPLKAYLPQCQNGAALVTTRSRSAALELVEWRDTIAVEPMSEVGAAALLEKKLEGIGRAMESASSQRRSSSCRLLWSKLRPISLTVHRAAPCAST